MNMDDVKWMKEAIKQAKKAESYDEVPIGCVIVKDDKIIARDITSEKLCNRVLLILKSWLFKKLVKN